MNYKKYSKDELRNAKAQLLALLKTTTYPEMKEEYKQRLAKIREVEAASR